MNINSHNSLERTFTYGIKLRSLLVQIYRSWTKTIYNRKNEVFLHRLMINHCLQTNYKAIHMKVGITTTNLDIQENLAFHFHESFTIKKREKTIKHQCWRVDDWCTDSLISKALVLLFLVLGIKKWNGIVLSRKYKWHLYIGAKQRRGRDADTLCRVADIH